LYVIFNDVLIQFLPRLHPCPGSVVPLYAWYKKPEPMFPERTVAAFKPYGFRHTVMVQVGSAAAYYAFTERAAQKESGCRDQQYQ